MAMKVGVVIGSLRKDSYNRKVSLAMSRLLSGRLELEEIPIGDLPLFSQDLEDAPPASVLELRERIRSKQGLLFVTPEYNRSMPGVLKNALDWGSRPYGQNSWAGKPAAMIGGSPAGTGTSMAQQHLRCVLGYLDVPTLGQPEMYLNFKDNPIEADGAVTDERTRKFLEKFADRYARWVEQLAAKV